MRVRIDKELCVGHGRCYVLAPDIFDYDEEGFSVLKQEAISSDLEAAARRGARGCPEGAITVDSD